MGINIETVRLLGVTAGITAEKLGLLVESSRYLISKIIKY